MKIEFDGMVFGKAEIEDNRQHLIVLRDAALKENQFTYAVALSHTLAILAVVAEEVDR